MSRLHISRGLPVGIVGSHHEALNRRLVELEGQQRRGLIARHAKVGAQRLRQILELLRGRRLVQPTTGLVRGVSRLAVVQPVIGFGHANRAVADSQQARLQILTSAHGVPAAVQEEDATPGVEASRHQCVVAAEQVAPAEVGALEEIDLGHHEIGQRIQDLMFVFDNLREVDDRGIQALLREVSSEVLILALKGADEFLKEKIFANMSKRAAELLRDDLEAKGPVRISEVETAQKEILGIARRMADAGEIQLAGGGEAMI